MSKDKFDLLKKVNKWGITNALKKHVGNVGEQIADVVIRGESPVKAVADLVFGESGKDIPQNLKEQYIEMTANDFERYKIEMENELELKRLRSAERGEARSAETERATSGSGIAKHFTYYLAVAVVVCAFALLLALMIFQIPESNETLINVAFGYVWGGFTSIIAFYFGASESEKMKS